MKDFTFRDKSIEFWTVSGEIISSNKNIETQITSSGGGGYISKGSGHIEAPTIHSKNIIVHEFWLKENNGNELSVSIRDIDIPLRIGQKVTLLISGLKNSNLRTYTSLINHSANKYWYFQNINQLIEYYKFKHPRWIFIRTVKILSVLSFFIIGVSLIIHPEFQSKDLIKLILANTFILILYTFLVFISLIFSLIFIYSPINTFVIPRTKRKLEKHIDEISSSLF